MLRAGGFDCKLYYWLITYQTCAIQNRAQIWRIPVCEATSFTRGKIEMVNLAIALAFGAHTFDSS